MLINLIFIASLWHITAAASAQPFDSQTVTYEAVTANSPTGISRLRVTKVDDNGYAIDFSIVAPNRTQHTGHIQGRATKDGRLLTLRVPNFQPNGVIDNPALCTVVIDVDDTRAQVVNEDKCAGFHGAAADFAEQGRNLIRVP